MYLIIGTQSCPNCELAKQLLDSRLMSYIYVDLTTKYGDWREVFSHLPPQNIGYRRSIPLVFCGSGSCAIPDLFAPGSSWKFLGGYDTLQSIFGVSAR
jgi:glutaredoxin